MERTITTSADLQSVLDHITFQNSVMNFCWRFEFQEIEVEYKGTATFFDAISNKTVTADSPKRKGWLMWASFLRPDTNTGEMSRGRGRDEVIFEGWTESSVVKTAWVVVEMLVKHELMEGYRYENARIFNPHSTVEQLASIQPGYQTKPKFEPIPEYGDVIPIREFFAQSDFFTSDDGHGYFATLDQMSDESTRMYGADTVPPEYTHVVWFNR